ncbi:MAG TPA: ABC transporter permease [Thermoanaerobaculia bacterium]|nr:ABC transporter permease [Thermoanaerobaculia bacterium]
MSGRRERVALRLLLRLLLRLYPRPVRERYGPEIADLFGRRLDERCAAAQRAARPLLVARAAADLALSAALERWSHLRSRCGARSHAVGTLAATLADLRLAARVLRRQPLFTAVAALALALGLGGSGLMFAVVDALLIEPLPFAHAERLVRLDETWRDEGRSVAYLNFLDWREQSRAFDRMAAVEGWSFALVSTDSEPEVVSGALVSGDLLAVLGVEPLLGRGLAPADFDPGAGRVAWIGEGLWRNRFGADPQIVGASLSLDGTQFTVTGVLPTELRYPTAGAEVWVPAELVLDRDDLENRDHHPGLHVLARLTPGATLAQAREEMERIADGLAAEHPDSNLEHGVRLRELQEVYVGRVRPAFVALLIAVGLVLLIACANVANLLLARAARRRPEMAMRATLGAGRTRLVRQLLTESALLAALGAGGGLLLAHWGIRGARALLADSLRLFGAERVALDARVLLVTVAVAALTALGFGLAPALQATRGAAAPEQRGVRARRAIDGSTRLQGGLAIAQVALSLVLLVGTGLMLASIGRLRATDLGLDPQGVLTFQLDLSGERWSELEAVVSFYDQLEAELRALPGIESVGAVRPLPLSGSNRQSGVHLLDSPERSPDESLRVDWGWVRAGYFEALRIPLLAGRGFEPGDRLDAEPVVVVDQTLAEAMFPDGALGRRIGFSHRQWEVVGVVGAVRHYGAREDRRFQLYVPHAQMPTGSLVVTVRSSHDPATLVAAVRQLVARLAPDQPVYAVRTLADLADRLVAREALLTMVLRAFAAVAVALAALGLYGVLAYAVTLRRAEIGLRMAIGATQRDVLLQVLRRGLALIAAGLALGLAAAPLGTRALASLLFGVSPLEPRVLAACAALLAATALAAILLPAWRATRVSPTVTLSEH